MLHVARCKYRTQKSRQKSPSGHHRTTSTGYVFAIKARIDNRKKILVKQQYILHTPYNMVNFGLLSAEVVSLVWGTPANFNGFRVLMLLNNFFPIVDACLICEDIARQSCAMVPRWRFLATFLGPAFAASRAQHISDLHSKFELGPRHV